MKKQHSDEYLYKVAHEELEVLEGIIDYAERMIREGDLSYRDLKRNAYGKALVIRRGIGGVATYRLGMHSLVYPKASSGYATPHSPIGRLLAVAGMGFEGCSLAWGDYEVEEERQFRRHSFEELEQHARNFLAMGVENASGQGKVVDLRAFVGKVIAKAQQLRAFKGTPMTGMPSEAIEGQKLEATPARDEVTISVEPPSVFDKLPVLKIVDDEENEVVHPLDLDDLEEEPDTEASERMSLDEHFFLNRTRNQDKIISRSPVGPMWVEGIAGSGKTSAALGRTKMLCDFNSNDVSDRATFRTILGDDFDYWEGKFAGKFSQEGSVGFVRTAELIQYLKETCSKLGMPSLPVQEYHELRSRLRNYRQLETSGDAGKRFKHSSVEGPAPISTLAWLNAARLAVARVIAANFREQLAYLDSEPGQRFTAHQRALLAIANKALSSSVNEFIQQLMLPVSTERVLHGLAANLIETSQALAQRILGPDTLSIHLAGHVVYGNGNPELAKRLAELPVDLFVSPERALILYREDTSSTGTGQKVQLCSSSGRYQFLSPAKQPLSFEAALNASRAGEDVRVLLPSITGGQSFEVRFLAVSELFISLGRPQSLLYLEDGALKWLKIVRAVGSLALPGEDKQSQLTVRKIFLKSALDHFVKPLKGFAGLYSRALHNHADAFPSAQAVQQVLQRIEDQRLNDADIDLLLCLAHDLSFGVTAKVHPSLREPAYYQSVFVDEVQDFTEQQIYLMNCQADPSYSAITVVGDRSQQLLRNEEMHIDACFPIGTRPEFVSLDENLRQKGQPELASFSAMLRKLFEHGAAPDVQKLNAALLHDQQSPQGAFTLRGFSGRDEEFRYLCSLIADIPENQTVAVVLPDQETAQELHAYCEQELEGSFRKMSMSEHIDLSKKYLVHFTSVLHVKGLEFDIVLLPMIEKYDLSQPVFRNRLYVGCSRARQRLVMSRLSKRIDARD
ncbi:ATP-binding domain-containing protein [Pseudomonas wenzhouensis]|uniref:ATP-binding domain-containing protein n=1 Tax=Pseudomonas wenzhouensis TaxID=2906062 RepID=UPI001E44801A|nr:ATP-binding domain-containing protein [Pseudomonas wenzhouensis]UFQ98664.1 ATP-binding domain-containing protein [Pseudomonas wenzhouensis]